MEKELQQAQEIYKLITEYFVTYSFQLLGAAIILILGIFIAKKVSNFVYKICESKELDITLTRFIASTTKIAIIVMIAVIALGKIGISVTPFVAAIGALSLGAGLAAQGLLSNYGAGLNIILARPFVVGDTIRVQNVIGQVKEVHLAHTILNDEDNVEITIPNKHIIGEVLSNSHSDTLAEETIGISYDSDPEEAVSVIISALNTVENMSTERKPQVGIENFADSSILIGIRFWAPTCNYFETRYRANAAIFKALKSSNITIPYPQREIRILSDKT
ncbi:MAG: mechanosensitive ion channel family protein [Gammaproteobacteria bacterium]|nr:mechanosensitive ion channel family protein [Gammaproteobacteria bacterium]